MDDFYVGAYWGDRPEPVGRCAERLAACLAGLAGIDRALARWFPVGGRRGAAEPVAETDTASLEQLLLEGRNRREDNGEVIEDLGFSVWLWNRSTPEVGLSASVGAYSHVAGIMNTFILRSDAPSPDTGGRYDIETAMSLLRVITEAWDPDWATWTTDELYDAQEPVRLRAPVVGWLTYLSGRRSDGGFEAGLDHRPFHDGHLVVAAPSLEQVEEPVVVDIRHRLQATGALDPTP